METIRHWFGRIIEIYQGIKNNELKINAIIEETTDMNECEKREFINRVKAMSMEELEIIADILPVELCLGRIHKELDKANQMRDTIKNMSSLIG